MMTWTEADATEFRAEAHGMAEAYRDALLDVLGEAAVDVILAKGSAYRSWDSVVDYVPEVSDVDVHARVRPRAGEVRTLEIALRVGERALEGFRQRFPSPRHTPRPQLFFLDHLESLPGYTPPAAETVHLLFGTYDGGVTRDSHPDTRVWDAKRLRADADFMSEELPGKVIDRPGDHLWRVVTGLTWRVGPTGPRLLTQLGEDPYDAWVMNRTDVAHALSAAGLDAVAEAYVDFYLAGWAGFESRFSEPEPAARALRAADRLATEARRLVDA